MEEDNHGRKNSRTFVLALISLIVFVLILLLFLYLIRRPALFGSFAQGESSSSILATPTSNSSTKSGEVSFDNSYLFASPLKASAGVERIRITAYILDGQGMGVSGKEISLGSSDLSVHVYSVSPTTDDSGRATFDISSDKSGTFTLEASVSGKKLNQKVSVTFN